MHRAFHSSRRSTHSSFPRRLSAALFIPMLCLAASVAQADPNVYVHASGNCGAFSPCYTNLDFALRNVDSNGTVTVLGNVAGTLGSTHGKTGITIQGSPATVEQDNSINIQEFVTDWTIKDLVITAPIQIRDVVGSITIQNVTANTINLGDFTVDTDAQITIQNVSALAGGINIIGDVGSSIAGNILIEDADIAGFNVAVHVGPGPETNLDADVTIRRTHVDVISGIRLDGTRATGVGNLNGTMIIEDSNCQVPQARFGIFSFGNVTGDIAGDVIMHNNICYWLAVLTTGSTQGAIGKITMTDNTVESLEIFAQEDDLIGDLLIQGNTLIEQGDVTDLPTAIILLVEADNFRELITIQDNVAGESEFALRARNGHFFKKAVVARNSLAFLTLDVQGAGNDYLVAPEIVDNTITTSDRAGYGVLTLRNRDGGDIPGATVTGNVADALRITATGPVTAPINFSGNTAREETTVTASAMGAGTLTAQGNQFSGESRFSGIQSFINFNRVQGNFTVVNGTTVDATYNWWGCDAGPDAAGCATLNNRTWPFTPWLTFNASADCMGATATANFDVLTASDGSMGMNNITPGSVTVTTSDGTVAQNPSPMSGTGMVGVTLNNGVSAPQFNVTLDSETRMVSANCSDLIFQDGFESGDVLVWSSSSP